MQLGDTKVRYDLNPESRPSWVTADFVARCKVVDDEEKHRAITRLAKEAEVDLPSTAPSRYAPMTWDHVRTQGRQGMTFGPRTVSHPILSHTQPKQALQEITESWRRLRAEARQPVPIFCYPIGRDADFGDREIEIVQELGFVGSLSAEADFADPVSFRQGNEGPFKTKRMPFPEDLSVLAEYAGGIERLRQIARRRNGGQGTGVR